jgi:putative peptidoglycan lipid II flippase
MQLPLGLFGVALGTVTLPLLSRLVVAGQMDAFRGELSRALRLMFVLTIPSTIGLMMLAEPIISVLYQHGKFDAHQTAEAAGALRYYALGLAGYAALKVLVNAFYALDRRKTPMAVGFLAVGFNLLFNWVFTFRLGWGHRGLAFSTGCVATCNFLLLYVLMHRHLGSLESRKMLGMLFKVGLAGAALAAVCAASSRWLLADWATQPLWSKSLGLIGTIVVAGGAFAASAALLKVQELDAVFAGIKRRLRPG